MKPNLARRKILSGDVISGPSVSYPAIEIVEEAISHGFDFVWVEWQHGGWSESTLSAALACFTGYDTVPVVRVLGSDPVWIGRVLDLGARGIIVPMVNTAAQCRQIVEAAKFPPEGRRSATGIRTAHLAGGNALHYTEQANPEILTIVMAETPEAVANVREMMSVPGVDCVLIGPYDLSRAMGAPSLNDPAVEELVQEVLRASKETGVAAGYVTNSVDQARARAEQGFRFVNQGHDAAVIPAAFRAMRSGF
ncbi:MAG: hypothetical protein FJW39_20935 [Acidobacteria bacterium]|nr:hypothetical protein [Acidobacteriota bacterium]